MNKRKKKKYERKFRQKVYYNVRKYKISRLTSDFIQTKKNADLINITNGPNLLHIIDCKKGNLKHPLKITCLMNLMPIGISSNTCDTNKILEVEI